jgi:uncharacterized caspase-like protein
MNKWASSKWASSRTATESARKFAATAMFLAAVLSPCTVPAQSEFNCSPIHDQDANPHPSSYRGSYALLVGVSDYEYWGKLPNVPQNINQLADVLCEKGFDVTVEMDPDSQKLRRSIERFIKTHGASHSARNNRLLVYYSGHGYAEYDEMTYHGYLVPRDAYPPTGNDASYIEFMFQAMTFDDVVSQAKRIRAKHSMFVIDACLSGSLFETSVTHSSPTRIGTPSKRTMDKRVIHFLTAGKAFQNAEDNRLFNDSFIGSITTPIADDDNDGVVTGTQLANFIHHRVHNATNGHQSPLYGKLQPGIIESGELTFRVPIDASE